MLTIVKQAEIGIQLGKILTSPPSGTNPFCYPQDSPLVGFWKHVSKRGPKSFAIEGPLIVIRKVHHEVRESIELGIIESIVYVFPTRLRCRKGFWIQGLEIADAETDK